MSAIVDERSDRPSHRPLASADRRYEAILSLEAARLARELRAVGPLPKRVLARRCGARRWRQGSFEAAVEAGIREHRLRRLPLDFIAAD